MHTDRTPGAVPAPAAPPAPPSRLGDVVIGVSTVVLDAFAALCVLAGFGIRALASSGARGRRGGPPPDWTPTVVFGVLALVAALVALGFTRWRMPVSATLQWLAALALLLTAIAAGGHAAAG